MMVVIILDNWTNDLDSAVGFENGLPGLGD